MSIGKHQDGLRWCGCFPETRADHPYTLRLHRNRLLDLRQQLSVGVVASFATIGLGVALILDPFVLLVTAVGAVDFTFDSEME